MKADFDDNKSYHALLESERLGVGAIVVVVRNQLFYEVE